MTLKRYRIEIEGMAEPIVVSSYGVNGALAQILNDPDTHGLSLAKIDGCVVVTNLSDQRQKRYRLRYNGIYYLTETTVRTK